jgi:predicted  nucleic acid-binding Zn-ribbon protein
MNVNQSPTKSPPAKPMPVYSDFSHMTAKQGIGGIRFAVSLREDNPDEIIGRVFPMTKIVPGVKKEKKERKVEKKVEEKVCTRPDCSARKEKMSELQDENKSLRLKLKNLEDKIETARNKITLTEKSIIMTEEKNDVLNGQIEDSQSRIFTIEADVEKGEKFNAALRRQLSQLQQDIERIKSETEEQNNQLRDMMDSKTEQKLVFSKDPKHKNVQLATEVSVLKFPTDGDDSD